eukprot:120122_1
MSQLDEEGVGTAEGYPYGDNAIGIANMDHIAPQQNQDVIRNSNVMTIKQWMQEMGYTLSDDAIDKLTKERFIFKSDLQYCSWEEIEQIATEIKISGLDRIKTKRAMEIMESFADKCVIDKTIEPRSGKGLFFGALVLGLVSAFIEAIDWTGFNQIIYRENTQNGDSLPMLLTIFLLSIVLRYCNWIITTDTMRFTSKSSMVFMVSNTFFVLGAHLCLYSVCLFGNFTRSNTSVLNVILWFIHVIFMITFIVINAQTGLNRKLNYSEMLGWLLLGNMGECFQFCCVADYIWNSAQMGLWGFIVGFIVSSTIRYWVMTHNSLTLTKATKIMFCSWNILFASIGMMFIFKSCVNEPNAEGLVGAKCLVAQSIFMILFVTLICIIKTN